MDITDVRVKLVQSRGDRLKAFCSITFDDEFVIRNVKIIDGVDGLFIAMPSRKMSERCAKCGGKNHFKAKFCNECGTALPMKCENQGTKPMRKFYIDIAHPINNKCRQRIQRKVIAAFNEEVERSKQQDYKPVQLDDDTQETFR